MREALRLGLSYFVPRRDANDSDWRGASAMTSFEDYLRPAAIRREQRFAMLPASRR